MRVIFHFIDTLFSLGRCKLIGQYRKKREGILERYPAFLGNLLTKLFLESCFFLLDRCIFLNKVCSQAFHILTSNKIAQDLPCTATHRLTSIQNSAQTYRVNGLYPVRSIPKLSSFSTSTLIFQSQHTPERTRIFTFLGNVVYGNLSQLLSYMYAG